MKMRNKGKVYPSSSSSSSTPVASPAGDSLWVLNLLPAAILGLVVVLSLEDQEVLAYMITRSINSTNPSSSSSSSSSSVGLNKKKKKTSTTHKPPLFECDCFDCYTSYWFKWDSSPNRELIHQAIEAFEDTFTNSQLSNNKKKTKKKERMLSHRHLPPNTSTPPPPLPELQVLPEYELEERAEQGAENQDGVFNAAEAEAEPPETAVVARSAAASQQKGMPDVIRLLKWRLWSLWSPNV